MPGAHQPGGFVRGLFVEPRVARSIPVAGLRGFVANPGDVPLALDQLG
jgi:hypothetical protein